MHEVESIQSPADERLYELGIPRNRIFFKASTSMIRAAGLARGQEHVELVAAPKFANRRDAGLVSHAGIAPNRSP